MTTLDNARKMLERLASDDEFRARVEADPIGGLAEYGFKIDPANVPKSVKLPEKAQIRANLDALSQEFHSTAGVVIFVR